MFLLIPPHPQISTGPEPPFLRHKFQWILVLPQIVADDALVLGVLDLHVQPQEFLHHLTVEEGITTFDAVGTEHNCGIICSFNLSLGEVE